MTQNDLLVCAHAGAIPLADESVQCVVTSPPYWGLRKYAGAQELIWDGDRSCAHKWGDTIEVNATNHTSTARWNHTRNGRDEEQPIEKRVAWLRTVVAQGCVCVHCGAWRGAYGLEPTIEMYVEHTVQILREIRRVLRRDGVVFWNIGDSYAGSWGNQGRKSERGSQRPINQPMIQVVDDQRYPSSGSNTGTVRDVGLKPKDLCLIPARVALAAQADGWWVRSLIIWAKPNPMPESVTDRPTDAYEHIILLTKSERYFWDADAVREASQPSSLARISQSTFASQTGGEKDYMRAGINRNRSARHALEGFAANGGQSRNMRNVWVFPTQPYRGAHFATFPEEIPRRAVLAATSAKGACVQCGAPWERVVRASGGTIGASWTDHADDLSHGMGSADGSDIRRGNATYRRREIGWRPTCRCRGQHGRTRPCVVLDPFGGSGTTGRVAIAFNRRPILLDLAYARATAEDREKAREYDQLAHSRTRGVQRQLL